MYVVEFHILVSVHHKSIIRCTSI